MTAPVIHLNGWPGCGKRTFGRVLADRIGGRLIDNHLILDPAVALFPRRSPEAAALREAVRDVVHGAALTLPNNIPLVLTDALSEDDHHLAVPSIAFAARRGAPFLPVLLDLDAGENARRLTAPERFG
ncbi:MAG: nucleoside kinase, partial [Pseudomonadota bacterium]